MFNNVLIGVDGRRGGRDAIALAKKLAAPGADVTLAHVYDWPVWRNNGVASLIGFEQATELLTRERRSGEIEAELVCVSGSPRGSVSAYLLRHVACPLLVLPRGATRPLHPAPPRSKAPTLTSV